MRQILGANANIGSSSTAIQLYKELGGKLQLVGDVGKVIDLINNHIDKDHPIEIGVNHSLDSGINNADKTTDHFLVITGRGYDSERDQLYFIYIETGRYATSASQAVGDNRLYYDEGKGTITGIRWDKDKIYELVQIRPNM